MKYDLVTPATTYTYYIDVKGQGGPVFAEIDPALLRPLDAEWSSNASEALQRMIGVDVTREHEVVILDGNETPLAVTDFRIGAEVVSSRPACDDPQVINQHEAVVLRFELTVSEPIDLGTFDFRPMAYDRHGGIFLMAIEFNGHVHEPIFHIA